VKISAIKRLLPALLLASLFFTPARHLAAQEAAPTATKAVSDAQSLESNDKEIDENDAYLHSPSVRAIGAKLGLTPEQAATAFTWANFLVLAVLVGWFLIKMLPKAFSDRSASIQKHLVDARTATQVANARLESVEARLSKLDLQIEALRTQAEKDALLDEQRIKASVEDEKQKILAAAEQEISAATVQARRQIQQYAAELAIDQAAKKLVVSAETDRLLVQDFARRLIGDDAKEGHN
jgi:F-type H+-transporting ATPase subunit b